MNKILAVVVLLLAVALGGCAGVSEKSGVRQRDLLLRAYSSAVRWNDFDAAWGYVDPAIRKDHPISDLERERFKQVQVVGYTVMHQELAPDGALEQSVELRLVNRNTQVERVVIDRQRWTYDAEAKRWWLASGLPNIEAR
jgi:uncharacterized protein YceK